MPKAKPADARERMIRVIEAQPPDATFDDLLRELTVARMVEQGLADIEAGRVISHAEMRKRVHSWRK